MTDRPGWDGLLAPDEAILWQGRPSAALHWRDAIRASGAFGLLFSAFAVFWIVMAASLIGGAGDGPGFPFSMFPLLGVPFLLVGLYMSVGHVIVDAHIRAHTWYTLTDRTAFVATELLGQKSLKRYPVFAMPFLDLEMGPQPGLGSVLFSDGAARGERPQGHARRIGFCHIAEAHAVYALLRDARGALNFADRQVRD